MLFFYIASAFAILFLLILLNYEFRRNLMMFQQNSYRPERYMKWLRKSGDSTSYARLIGIFLLLFCLAGFKIEYFAIICVNLFAICISVNLALKKYKKPLVFTKRVIRLFCVNFFVTVILTGVAIVASMCGMFGIKLPLYTSVVTLLLIYCISPVIIFISYYILQPVEKSINRKFYNNAKDKLDGMPDLKIIGITGSYGKTSTKHYLYRILSEHIETLMTPGSFNTTLGVVRTINEQLKPYHQAFIVEMGAKQTGDIKEICDLVNPEYGIITAVGPQHLETFHTIENVRDTKFELIDSLPENGYAFLNNDYEIIADRVVSNCHAIRYSCSTENETADYIAKDIRYHSEGTEFNLQCPDRSVIRFETKLLGEYNIANLTGAIAVALQLGIPLNKIQYSVSRIEAVEHRLSIRRHSNGLTVLDDAFNSNPVGASMAVNVLAGMKTGRRFIITPGMIELGDKQYELNSAFGKQIAESGIEFIAVVGQYNKEAITEGLLAGGRRLEDIHYFNTFLEANAWMVSISTSGDVVLIENDLPDTFK